jgi:phage repressor protein C with HTH and peptisase S24 domain
MDRNRLLEAMEKRGFSQSDLARAIGVTQGTINQLISGRTAKTRYAGEIARALQVSVDWLNGHDAPSGLQVKMPDVDFVQLTELDIGYGMGGGTFIEEYGDHTPRVFDPSWIRDVTRSPPEMLFLARGLGDSMSPTLLDNDIVIVDRGQRTLTQQDRIWAVTYGELGMIKRVRRRPDGTILLMSDNTTVPPIEASAGEVNIVGRIVWVGRKT